MWAVKKRNKLYNNNMKVAIVGGSDSKIYAPYQDESFEIWSVNNTAKSLPRLTRWFQLHKLDVIERTQKDLDSLKNSTVPLYMQEQFADYAKSIKYPYDEMIEKYGKVFGSSFDYMMALAIKEGATEIQVYGVDMASYSEYGYQRPYAFYWVGMARGLGIIVNIHEACGIYREQNYGYDEFSYEDQEKLLQAIKDTRQQIIDVKQNLAYSQGMEIGIKAVKDNVDGALTGIMAMKEKQRELNELLMTLNNQKEEMSIALSEIQGYRVNLTPPDIELIPK